MAIIYAKNDLIIGLGEKSPIFQYYKIRMRDCTDMASVGKADGEREGPTTGPSLHLIRLSRIS